MQQHPALYCWLTCALSHDAPIQFEGRSSVIGSTMGSKSLGHLFQSNWPTVTQIALTSIFEELTLVVHMDEKSASRAVQAATMKRQKGPGAKKSMVGSTLAELGVTKRAMGSAPSFAATKRSKVVGMYSSQKAKAYPFQLPQLFDERPDCKEPRFVTIFGAPGSGKSTYLQRIQYEWACGGGQDMWHGKIRFLFNVSIRDAESNPRYHDCSVAELLWGTAMPPEDLANMTVEEFTTVLSQNSSQVCIMLDGSVNALCAAVHHESALAGLGRTPPTTSRGGSLATFCSC